jgi:hypothetical protein
VRKTAFIAFAVSIALVSIALLGLAGVASAGPIIISGTDADDHGSVAGGVNQSGWLYMQSALDNVGGQVTNGNKLAVCIGCNATQAQNAFASAFDLSTLPGAGWTRVTLTAAADITNFMTNAGGGTKISQAGIIYMPTATANVTGGITAVQLAPVNANAAALNAYVAAGGGLFTQDQCPCYVGGGYGWLTTLLPGIVLHGDVDGTISNSGSLTRTAAGIAAFPGISDALLSGATPWHDWFSGSFGGLSVLVTGPAIGPTGGIIDGAVVLGGGAGTVIQCGQPGQPACPTPEPATLLLLGSGLLMLGGLAWSRRRSS